VIELLVTIDLTSDVAGLTIAEQDKQQKVANNSD
jgi:hypothetical protein